MTFLPQARKQAGETAAKTFQIKRPAHLAEAELGSAVFRRP